MEPVLLIPSNFTPTGVHWQIWSYFTFRRVNTADIAARMNAREGWVAQLLWQMREWHASRRLAGEID